MSAILFTLIAIILTLYYTNISISAVNLPWSTTFDCNDWKTSDGGSTGCDGLSKHGDWSCKNGDNTVKEEQITTAANYPGGAGGKGQRHWKGYGYDNNSGGLRVNLSSQQSEIWIRWYMRYERNFRWIKDAIVTDKWLIIFSSSGKRVVVEHVGADRVQFDVNGKPYSSPNGYGWYTLYGGAVADGSWHGYEIHMKIETQGAFNGIIQLWIDGQKVINKNNIKHGVAGWNQIVIGSNNLWPNMQHCMYVDFDDIAISNTGPIGALPPNKSILSPSNK